MVTEAEALQKWCCSHQDEYCTASQCMAWRWFPAVGDETKIEAIKRYREETGSTLVESKNYVESHPEYFKRPPSDRGYCGLAGKPDTGEA